MKCFQRKYLLLCESLDDCKCIFMSGVKVSTMFSHTDMSDFNLAPISKMAAGQFSKAPFNMHPLLMYSSTPHFLIPFWLLTQCNSLHSDMSCRELTLKCIEIQAQAQSCLIETDRKQAFLCCHECSNLVKSLSIATGQVAASACEPLSSLAEVFEGGFIDAATAFPRAIGVGRWQGRACA